MFTLFFRMSVAHWNIQVAEGNLNISKSVSSRNSELFGVLFTIVQRRPVYCTDSATTYS